MSGILVQTREVSPLLHEVRPQGAPRVVPNLIDPSRRRDQLPLTPVGLSDGVGDPPRRHHAQAPLSIGSLLHLAFVGLVAAGIVAVFFGAGFSLLVSTSGGMISGSANRAGPEAMSPLPSLGDVDRQTFFGRASASENKDAALNSAFPAPAEAPAIDGKDDVPHLDGVLASRASPDMPAASANATVPELTSPTAIAHAPPTSGFSGAEMAELVAHGDTLLRNADLASARLFYERAANAGDGRAALRLGATFDPEFLGRLGLGKLQANPAVARSWYSRARDLGAVDAKAQPNSIETRQRK
jgi:hypothetical protein